MLTAFYTAFSPACFALLGLWMVVVQLRITDWNKSDDIGKTGRVYQRRSYGVALHLALPGLMCVLALVSTLDALYWQVAFVVIALSGAVIMYLDRPDPAPLHHRGVRKLHPADPRPRAGGWAWARKGDSRVGVPPGGPATRCGRSLILHGQ